MGRCVYGLVDFGLQIIGRGRLADRGDLAVFSPEGRGGASEIGEDIAEGGPAVMAPGLFHLCPEDMNGLIGQDGDQQMAIRPAHLW